MTLWQIIKHYRYTVALVVVIAVLFVPLGVYQLHQRAECAARGGEYVRGVWWFVCVGDGRR